MNKFFFVIILVLGISSQILAQDYKIAGWDYNWDQKAHEKGQIHFSYGYGQPRLDKKLFDYHKHEDNFRVVGIGAFYWKTEYGLSRKLSVLLSTSYILYKSDWKRMRPDPLYGIDLPFKYGSTLTDISANLRFNYHLFVNKEFDIYLGGGAGYNYFAHKDFTDYSPDDSTFNAHFKDPHAVSYEMSFGIRYFFLTRTAIYLEAGYGKSLAQAGFVFKFRHRKRG